VIQRLAIVLLVIAAVACHGKETPADSSPVDTALLSGPQQAQPAMMPADQVKPVPAELPGIVARVNGEAIDRAQFDQAVRSAEGRAGQPVPAEQRDQVYRAILDQLIAYRVLLQETTTRKVSVPDSAVDESMAELRSQFPSEEALNQALTAQGLTLDRLRQEARVDMLISKMLEEEIEPTVSVSDKDVKAFYDENQEQFQEEEAVRASHVLIRLPEGADAAAREEARKRAEQILKQARAGGDFAAIARDNSQDAGSAAQGGDLGFFTRGQLVPSFEEAAFALKPGEISGVVESPFGFHIIRAAERRKPRVVPFSEVNGEIAQFLSERQRQEKSSAFIEKLKAKSKIEVYM
jgi:peptidyl-prolyl cis-trans isomerase C